MSPAGASDTDVDPEISVNYELGARLRRGALYGEAMGFYSDYSNTVQNCSIANPCGGQTSGSVSKGESRIAGLETLVGYEMPLTSGLTLPVSATWTYTDAEITQDSDDGSVFSGDNLAYLPEHVFNVRAGVKNGDLWDLYLNVAFVDDMCINTSCEPDPCSGTCR
jgi:Fe(3+) dicitrate transport protein